MIESALVSKTICIIYGNVLGIRRLLLFSSLGCVNAREREFAVKSVWWKEWEIGNVPAIFRGSFRLKLSLKNKGAF